MSASEQFLPVLQHACGTGNDFVTQKQEPRRSERLKALWIGPECQVLKSLKAAIASGSPEDWQRIREFSVDVADTHWADTARTCIDLYGELYENQWHRAGAGMQAFFSTALAAAELVHSSREGVNPAEFDRHVARALTSWSTAWSLDTLDSTERLLDGAIPLIHPIPESAGESAREKAKQAGYTGSRLEVTMAESLASVLNNQQLLESRYASTTSWPAFERTLFWLLKGLPGFDTPAAHSRLIPELLFENVLHVPLYRHAKGSIVPFRVEVRAAQAPGIILDPVALGGTAIGGEMIEQVLLALEGAIRHLSEGQHMTVATPESVAVLVAPDFSAHSVPHLQGSSAGALLGAGVSLAIRQRSVPPNVTFTGQLDRRDPLRLLPLCGSRAEVGGDIWNEYLSSLKQKAAACIESHVLHFGLSQSEPADTRSFHLDARLQLHEIDSWLADVEYFLDTVNRTETWQEIERFRRAYLGTSDRLEPFGGRDEVLGQLDTWLSDPQSPPYFLIDAPTGRGKSAIVVRWLERLAANGECDVVFYPVSIRFKTNGTGQFLRELALRLAIARNEPLPDEVDAPHELWRNRIGRSLQTPASDATQRPLLVVIDGIDEGINLVDDLRKIIPDEPPPGLRILLTARSRTIGGLAQPWLDALVENEPRLRPLFATSSLAPLTETGLADVLRQTGFPLDRLAERVDIVSELQRLTEGDPLLVNFYVLDLWERGDAAARLQPEDLAAIAPGWDGYIEKWWADQERLWKDSGVDVSDSADLLIDILAFAFGPLTRRDLLQLARSEKITGRKLDRLLPDLSRMIISVGADEPAFVLQHPKLAEYFRSRLERDDEHEAMERRFVDWGNSVLDAMEREPTDIGYLKPALVPSYLLHYFVSHLHAYYVAVKGCEFPPPKVFGRLVEKTWGDAWFTFEGAWDGFSQNVSQCWDWYRKADEQELHANDRAPYIGRQVHCALIESTFVSLARNIPIQLILRAVETNVWSVDRAFAVASRLDSVDDITLQLGLIPQLPEDEQVIRTRELLERIRREFPFSMVDVEQNQRRMAALHSFAGRAQRDALEVATKQAINRSLSASETAWEDMYAWAFDLAWMQPALPSHVVDWAFAPDVETEFNDLDGVAYALCSFAPAATSVFRAVVLKAAEPHLDAIIGDEAWSEHETAAVQMICLHNLIAITPLCQEQTRSACFDKLLCLANSTTESSTLFKALLARVDVSRLRDVYSECETGRIVDWMIAGDHRDLLLQWADCLSDGQVQDVIASIQGESATAQEHEDDRENDVPRVESSVDLLVALAVGRTPEIQKRAMRVGEEVLLTCAKHVQAVGRKRGPFGSERSRFWVSRRLSQFLPCLDEETRGTLWRRVLHDIRLDLDLATPSDGETFYNLGRSADLPPALDTADSELDDVGLVTHADIPEIESFSSLVFSSLGPAGIRQLEEVSADISRVPGEGIAHIYFHLGLLAFLPTEHGARFALKLVRDGLAELAVTQLQLDRLRWCYRPKAIARYIDKVPSQARDGVIREFCELIRDGHCPDKDERDATLTSLASLLDSSGVTIAIEACSRLGHKYDLTLAALTSECVDAAETLDAAFGSRFWDALFREDRGMKFEQIHSSSKRAENQLWRQLATSKVIKSGLRLPAKQVLRFAAWMTSTELEQAFPVILDAIRRFCFGDETCDSDASNLAGTGDEVISGWLHDIYQRCNSNQITQIVAELTQLCSVEEAIDKNLISGLVAALPSVSRSNRQRFAETVLSLLSVNENSAGRSRVEHIDSLSEQRAINSIATFITDDRIPQMVEVVNTGWPTRLQQAKVLSALLITRESKSARRTLSDRVLELLGSYHNDIPSYFSYGYVGYEQVIEGLRAVVKTAPAERCGEVCRTCFALAENLYPRGVVTPVGETGLVPFQSEVFHHQDSKVITEFIATAGEFLEYYTSFTDEEPAEATAMNLVRNCPSEHLDEVGEALHRAKNNPMVDGRYFDAVYELRNRRTSPRVEELVNDLCRLRTQQTLPKVDELGDELIQPSNDDHGKTWSGLLGVVSDKDREQLDRLWMRVPPERKPYSPLAEEFSVLTDEGQLAVCRYIRSCAFDDTTLWSIQDQDDFDGYIALVCPVVKTHGWFFTSEPRLCGEAARDSRFCPVSLFLCECLTNFNKGASASIGILDLHASECESRFVAPILLQCFQETIESKRNRQELCYLLHKSSRLINQVGGDQASEDVAFAALDVANRWP